MILRTGGNRYLAKRVNTIQPVHLSYVHNTELSVNDKECSSMCREEVTKAIKQFTLQKNIKQFNFTEKKYENFHYRRSNVQIQLQLQAKSIYISKNMTNVLNHENATFMKFHDILICTKFILHWTDHIIKNITVLDTTVGRICSCARSLFN